MVMMYVGAKVTVWKSAVAFRPCYQACMVSSNGRAIQIWLWLAKRFSVDEPLKMPQYRPLLLNAIYIKLLQSALQTSHKPPKFQPKLKLGLVKGSVGFGWISAAYNFFFFPEVSLNICSWCSFGRKLHWVNRLTEYVTDKKKTETHVVWWPLVSACRWLANSTDH